MNTSFFLNMKNTFFHSGNKPFRKGIGTITPKIICIVTIAFASFFVSGCNGNNSSDNNKKKTDTVYVQPNNQRGEGEGMDDDRRGMDSTHRGMGMDSMRHRKHQ